MIRAVAIAIAKAVAVAHRLHDRAAKAVQLHADTVPEPDAVDGGPAVICTGDGRVVFVSADAEDDIREWLDGDPIYSFEGGCIETDTAVALEEVR
jgi:hypothetical protein